MTEPQHVIVVQGKDADEPDRRVTIRSPLEGGAVKAASQAARLILQERPSLMNFRFLRQLVDRLKPDEAGLKPFKVALVSTFAIEFIHDSLIAVGLIIGVRIEIYPNWATKYFIDALLLQHRLGHLARE